MAIESVEEGKRTALAPRPAGRERHGHRDGTSGELGERRGAAAQAGHDIAAARGGDDAFIEQVRVGRRNRQREGLDELAEVGGAGAGALADGTVSPMGPAWRAGVVVPADAVRTGEVDREDAAPGRLQAEIRLADPAVLAETAKPDQRGNYE